MPAPPAGIKTCSIAFGFAILIVLITMNSGGVQTVYGSSMSEEIYNIQFAAHVSESQRNAIIAELNGELIGWIEPLHIAAIRLKVKDVDAPQGLSSAEEQIVYYPAIEFAEPEQPVRAAYSPNDPDVTVAERAYNLHRVQAMAGWDLELGDAEIIIAVVDTGISPDHAEFAARLVPGYDFVNNDNGPDDDHGHGTHVAGIIGAAIDNQLGIAGICPRCSLMPVKVLDEHNIGSWFTAAQGLVYAVDHGARVINLSLGASAPSSTIEAAINYAESKGVLVVAAAGNAGSHEPFYPAAYENVLSVAATDGTDALWQLSNFGETIDVTAPGHLIYGVHPDMNNKFGGFTFKSGTSMASPHVAGLAGLLLSTNASYSPDELRRIIVNTADDLGTQGWDSQYGYGRINVYSALTYGEQSSGQLATRAVEPELTVFLPITAP